MGTVFHCVRQSALFDVFYSKMVAFLSIDTKACLNGSQTVMTDNLCIEQGDQLLPAIEIRGVVVTLVRLFKFLEFLSRKKL